MNRFENLIRILLPLSAFAKSNGAFATVTFKCKTERDQRCFRDELVSSSPALFTTYSEFNKLSMVGVRIEFAVEDVAMNWETWIAA